MDATPIYWQCPGCGLTDGWDVARTLRRVWVDASCPFCDLDYRVLVTQAAVGAPEYRIVIAGNGDKDPGPGERCRSPRAESAGAW